jgi:energy-converting hydrogenase Eha subunit G
VQQFGASTFSLLIHMLTRGAFLGSGPHEFCDSQRSMQPLAKRWHGLMSVPHCCFVMWWSGR